MVDSDQFVEAAATRFEDSGTLSIVGPDQFVEAAATRFEDSWARCSWSIRTTVCQDGAAP